MCYDGKSTWAERAQCLGCRWVMSAFTPAVGFRVCVGGPVFASRSRIRQLHVRQDSRGLHSRPLEGAEPLKWVAVATASEQGAWGGAIRWNWQGLGPRQLCRE